MKIGQEVFGVEGFVTGKIEVGLEEVKILMVMGENDMVRVVEKTWMDNVVGA